MKASASPLSSYSENSARMLVRQKLKERRDDHHHHIQHSKQNRHHCHSDHHHQQLQSSQQPRKSLLKEKTKSPQQQKKATCKVVSFAKASVVKLIPKLNFRSNPDTAYQVWYSKKEFHEMRDRTDLMLSLLNHGIIEPHNEPHGSDEYCCLGLEGCYGEGREVSDALHVGGRAAVLLQQTRIKQHPQHYIREESDKAILLRTSYIEFTERAAAIAHQRGRNMSKAIQEYVKNA
jgi:hypothetical protein